MRSIFSISLSVIIGSFLVLGLCSLAIGSEEEAKPADSTAVAAEMVDSIKIAMEDFHQVLVPLWHESFPEQDFKTIRQKASLLKEKLLNLIRTKPPANLEQDKEKLTNFQAKRQELAFHVAQVEIAAKDGSDSTLASAFEKMHWAYEELDKVFAEPLKELDSFHETLYFLWHKALPERNYQAMRETAPVIKAEVDSLMKAKIPEGCHEKKEDFDKKRAALKDAVYQFADKCEKGSEEEIDESLKALHHRFMELNLLLR